MHLWSQAKEEDSSDDKIREEHMSSQCSHYEDDDQVTFGGFRHRNARLRNIVKFEQPSCKIIPFSFCWHISMF